MTTTPPSPAPPPEPIHGPPPVHSPPPASTSPEAGKPQKRGTWLVALTALAVSLLSLVVAVTSLASARAARGEAADAERLAEALSPGSTGGPPPATGNPITGPTIEPLPTDSPQGTETPSTFDPQAAFDVKYSDQVLTPQVTTDDRAYIDLDEPRVVFEFGQADLVLDIDDFGSDPPHFDLQEINVTAAEVGSPDVTPKDCLERLRTSPLPPSAQVPAQRGTVLCVLTSLSRAADQGISQKLVVLHVSALGDEGRVSIEMDAWEQPR